jgi:hypothetical protein
MKWSGSNRNTDLRIGDIDMILNIIATAIDVIMILSLMMQQVNQTDNSNAMGYLLSYAIFAMNIMVIWK